MNLLEFAGEVEEYVDEIFQDSNASRPNPSPPPHNSGSCSPNLPFNWEEEPKCSVTCNLDEPSQEHHEIIFFSEEVSEDECPRQLLHPSRSVKVEAYLAPELESTMEEHVLKYPKNIIKNFMVEFSNYVNRPSDKNQILSFLEKYCILKKPLQTLAEIQQYMKDKRKVSSAKELERTLNFRCVRELFVHFLVTKAEEWINGSNKLQLKLFHKKAIDYLTIAAETCRTVRFPILEWKKDLVLE